MTDSGYPSVPSYVPPPVEEPGPEIPTWVILVAVGVALIGGAVLALALLTGGDEEEKKIAYPAAWDSRVAPLVKVVENKRGLTFLHPVTVRFLPDAAFEKTVTADEKDLDKEERAQIDQAAGFLRALGLLKGDVDLFAAFNQTQTSGTLAYYAFADERITIRGDRLTPAIRATLVHELTHALQDQHFQIGNRMAALAKESEEDTAATTEGTVFDAIIEGDAERVAGLYTASLNAKQRKALDAGRSAENNKGTDALKGVPKVILTIFSSPYTLGESMVQTVAASGGNKAVDELFRDTPTHEASLFDPFQVLAGRLGAKKVDVPEVTDGEKKHDSGEFGVLTWYFMLAERIPLLEALAVADGWGGDAYVDFERDGLQCARVAYVGDSARDTTAMLGALRRWIAAAPGAPAKVSRTGARLLFESCDPGTSARVGKDVSGEAMALAASRTNIAIALLRAGAPEKAARCVADRLIQAFTIQQLSDPKFGAGDPAVRQKIFQLASACR